MAPPYLQYYEHWKSEKRLQDEPATKLVLNIADCRENVQ